MGAAVWGVGFEVSILRVGGGFVGYARGLGGRSSLYDYISGLDWLESMLWDVGLRLMREIGMREHGYL